MHCKIHPCMLGKNRGHCNKSTKTANNKLMRFHAMPQLSKWWLAIRLFYSICVIFNEKKESLITCHKISSHHSILSHDSEHHHRHECFYHHHCQWLVDQNLFRTSNAHARWEKNTFASPLTRITTNWARLMEHGSMSMGSVSFPHRRNW